MSKNRLTVKATPQGLTLAQNALKRLGGTQLSLAKKLTGSVGRSTIQKFFKGEEIQVNRFQEICRELSLESQWEAIAGLTNLSGLVDLQDNQPPEAVKEQQNSSIDINALVEEIREKVKPYTKERCGTMRVLDMTQPIGLGDIYTDVNILEEVTGRKRREIAELLQNCNLEDFDRFGLSKVTQERVPGLQAVKQHSKLMVLGKPGAGKTTFLKYLAIQCIEGEFQSDHIPIFITLKDFAEAPEKPDILDYIAQQLFKCKVTDANVKAEQLLEQGKVLILLDGLDEVREEDTSRVLKQVQEFSHQYSTNQFIITCRIAAKEYTFQGFTEVEVADFNSLQIATFAQNWFQLRNDPVKGKRFIEKLKENKPIEELATNPLLLTLLCLVFGEAGDFPANRSELYTEGVDVLLKKWDVGRNIERDKVYKDLSLQRKEDLLSNIALTTFEQKNYFFKKKTVEEHIADFIRNLRNANTAPEVLELDSEAILKSIEAQHGLLVARAAGIYSFSHLTFHEYFTARGIKERFGWARLVEHVTEKRWSEVFLLTTEMLQSADDLVQLMKQKIDGLLAEENKLQQFLGWLDEKSQSKNEEYKPSSVRAFFLEIAIDHYLSDFNLTNDVYRVICYIPSYLETASSRDVFLQGSISNIHGYSWYSYLTHKLDHRLSYAKLLGVRISPKLADWWVEFENNAMTLWALITEYSEINQNWQLDEEQQQLLQQYYDANKLLIDCLNSDCYVSREVRQEIEDTLLLPAKR